MSVTGGCQCGAIRYRVDGELGRSSVCHCRMCQKAFGGFFGPYVAVTREQVTWTRGAPKLFASSNLVNRGFCPDCGTQLTFEGADFYDLSTGSFDDPTGLAPVIQIGLESKLPYVDDLHTLRTASQEGQAKTAAYQAKVVSHQHPDHDT